VAAPLKALEAFKSAPAKPSIAPALNPVLVAASVRIESISL